MPKAKKSTMFRMLPFERFVRDIAAGNSSGEVRFSEDSMDLIQKLCENYLIDLYDMANEVAKHGSRNTVMARDIMLVRKIRGL